ncbi:hypothetical protein EUX98_g9378 [Antrodiella citrinella]|uniref:JmjC domain-containing protein n=1 Tax=Antrodiella citrinella TaxID=2447956 RepID=A0A4S4LW74_9APHY|nr:hypothetical protein EUX98_g9378 [Antrodiella citrinella]
MAAHKGPEQVFTGDTIQRYLIVVESGDILIQGAGQWHEVYTPVPTITTGAHFYSLDTMHMVEAVLRYDCSIESADTNFNHDSVYDHETAIRNAKLLLKHLEEIKSAVPHDQILGAGFYEPGEDVDIHRLISLLE